MKTSATVLEPELAWAIWHGLAKLSDLLWERYEKEFSKFTQEERINGGQMSQEDIEIEIPF